MYNSLTESPLLHIIPSHHQQPVSQKSTMAACSEWFSEVAKEHHSESLVERTNYLHIKQNKVESTKIGG